MRLVINGGTMKRQDVSYLNHYLLTAKERERCDEVKTIKKVRKLTLTEKIELYDKVKLLNLTEHLMLDITIVPDYEVNHFEGKYGQYSALGQNILGNVISSDFHCESVNYKIVSASGMRS